MKIVYIFLFSFYVIFLYDSKVFGSTLQGIAEYVRRNLLFFLSDCTLGANKTRLLFFSRGISGMEVNLTTMELPINCSLKTIFIIHGFLSDGTKNWINDTVKALLKNEPLNVFSVDWQVGACSEKIDFLNIQSYRSAAANTKQVGEYIARCIKILVKNYHVSLANIWMLGHSLGAHVCGFVGKHLQINRIGTLGRITGLDPAGPLFRQLNWTERLDRSDAIFVDIIHTSQIFGLQEPIGHVDIFVNGGEFQPSCLLKKPGCSHDRAVDYYIEALKNPNCSFIGQKWSKRSGYINSSENCNLESCMVIGQQAESYAARGTFIVNTHYGSPYCTGNLPSSETVDAHFNIVSNGDNIFEADLLINNG